MHFKPLVPALACLLTACASPMVTPDGPTMQSRAGFVKDWDELAERAADHFVAQCRCNEVFVAPGVAHMEFGIAFRRLLEEKLYRRNIGVYETTLPLSPSSPPPVVLTFEVQPFLYDHMGRQVPLVLLPVAVAFDDIASVYDTSRAEVMLTVSVADGTRLRYIDSTEFYVRPKDLALYDTSSGSRHWVNDNPASGVSVEWPDNDYADENHPALDALIGPERKAIMGEH